MQQTLPPFSHHPPLSRSLLPWLSTLAAILALIVQPAHAQEMPAAEPPEMYLVQFQPGLSEAERAAWVAQQGAELISWMPQINVAALRLVATQGGDLAAAGVDTSAVVYWEADAPVWAARTITEPAFSYPNKSYAQELLRIGAAWDITDGSDSIIIAIIDTGIDPNHPELAGRLTAGYDYINDDNDATDDSGHGTHVAGIVAAGLNGEGTAGVCPQCKLMPIKALNGANGGSVGAVAQSILYAVDHGAKVINLSLGTPIPSATLEYAVSYAHEHHVMVVAAAGNQGSDVPFYPASIPYAVAVGGTDQNDARWIKSNYGDNIDFVAPAVSIYSAYYDHSTGSSTYAYISGTSMSTAFVSGLAALALSHRPDATGNQILDLLIAGAIDLNAAGKDAQSGYGRIDAYNTLLAANDGIAPIVDSPIDPGNIDGNRNGILDQSRPIKLYLPVIGHN